MDGQSDIFVHTPSRAVNSDGAPSRAAFIIMLDSSDLNTFKMVRSR